VIHGVDPGLKGTRAYRDEAGAMCCVPLTADWRPAAGDVVWLEETLQVPGRSVQSTSTTERNYGDLLRRIRDAGAELHTVHPRTWQAALGFVKARGEKSTAYKLRMARALGRVYPSIGAMTDADAVGILHYGRSKMGKGLAA
jgi:hypothetical protein